MPRTSKLYLSFSPSQQNPACIFSFMKLFTLRNVNPYSDSLNVLLHCPQFVYFVRYADKNDRALFPTYLISTYANPTKPLLYTPLMDWSL